MAQEEVLHAAQTVSIGGESLPMTMQAEYQHLSVEEAVASGLFDVPDEPGWVRIPVTFHVMIPGELLESSAGQNGP